MSNVQSSKNKLFNKNNFLNWIIGGVIALIITKASDPLSEFLFSNILNIGGSFITRISNSTYREISNGFSEQSSSIVLSLSYLFFICFLECIFFIFLEINKTIKNKSNKLFSSNNNTTSFEENSNVTSDNIHEQESETLNKWFEKKYEKLFFLNFTSIILLIFSFLAITFIYGQSNFIRNKTITMTNNMEIVSPYITDLEYKQLKSHFHSIETQSDYETLMEELETIADKYFLKLK